MKLSFRVVALARASPANYLAKPVVRPLQTDLRIGNLLPTRYSVPQVLFVMPPLRGWGESLSKKIQCMVGRIESSVYDEVGVDF